MRQVKSDGMLRREALLALIDSPITFAMISNL
jgi:hypothetical protein